MPRDPPPHRRRAGRAPKREGRRHRLRGHHPPDWRCPGRRYRTARDPDERDAALLESPNCPRAPAPCHRPRGDGESRALFVRVSPPLDRRHRRHPDASLDEDAGPPPRRGAVRLLRGEAEPAGASRPAQVRREGSHPPPQPRQLVRHVPRELPQRKPQDGRRRRPGVGVHGPRGAPPRRAGKGSYGDPDGDR